MDGFEELGLRMQSPREPRTLFGSRVAEGMGV